MTPSGPKNQLHLLRIAPSISQFKRFSNFIDCFIKVLTTDDFHRVRITPTKLQSERSLKMNDYWEKAVNNT